MANSGVLSSHVDDRQKHPNTRPVWERVLTFTIEADGGASEIKVALPINGILQKVICAVGDAVGITGTVDLAIDDNGNNEIFAVTSLAENIIYPYSVNEPLSGMIDVGINPSDDPATGEADWTITVTLRGI